VRIDLHLNMVKFPFWFSFHLLISDFGFR